MTSVKQKHLKWKNRRRNWLDFSTLQDLESIDDVFDDLVQGMTCKGSEKSVKLQFKMDVYVSEKGGRFELTHVKISICIRRSIVKNERISFVVLSLQVRKEVACQ